MKKLIIILILILFTGCNENTLKTIGYSNSDISIIKKLNSDNQDYLNSLDYNESYISIIENDDFNENNLKKYIEFFNKFNLDIDDVIFIVNNSYDDLDDYSDRVLSFMKSKYYIHKNLERYLNYETNNEIEYIITCVNSNLDYDYYTNTKKTDLSKGYLILVNKYNYLDSSYVPDNLVDIDSKYGKALKLEKTTYEAFIKMYNDAANDGVNLYAFSPYRSYSTQYSLYNTYVARDGKTRADTYSARAGFSEHQTGLAIDIVRYGGNLTGFENTKEFEWLKENCYKYGFILRYPSGKEFITGYQYEPWHYRYVGVDVAKEIYDLDITFEEYYAYYIDK